MDYKMKYRQMLFFLLFLCLSTYTYCNSPTILYPCKGNQYIQFRIPKNQPNNEEKNFYLLVDKKLAPNTIINITLILPSERSLENPTSVYTFISEEIIDGVLFKETSKFIKWLKTVKGRIPYVSGLLVNNVEECKNPSYSKQGGSVGREMITTHNFLVPTPEDSNCGRRKLSGSGYIVNGFDTLPGAWPWHVAISQVEISVTKYICGGTLLSKSMVLTAAHCVTTQSIPVVTSSLLVSLGLFNLFSGNTGRQEKQVHRIMVHKDYNETLYQNDIALLRLKSEAVFSNYVQPACLWREGDFAKLPNPQIYGTVVGWGINKKSQLSFTLKQIHIPKIPDIMCMKSNDNFFPKALTDKNFCAGYRNGSSVCNGDSGGGFMVFIPDSKGDTSEHPAGTWHVRGITSSGVVKDNLECDPYEYSIFTDVSKYLDWIHDRMDS